jgi:integration host factor subunit beta
MTKSALIDQLAMKHTHFQSKDVGLSVKIMIEYMIQSLANGERIEIRGFGSFSLHYRAPSTGRNPKTGEAVALTPKYAPHFKPGLELKSRVNNSRL